MALRIPITNSLGYVDTYHRVGLISKDHKYVVVYVLHYADEEHRDANVNTYEAYPFNEVEGEISIAKGYELLKTLPQYEGAKDV